ncbi:MAG: 50S ribosomal protein L35 [Deltaproteobacteria bacterium]|nr:50S ribosomal protein L35 [Deltaproteobacteria bacterium]
MVAKVKVKQKTKRAAAKRFKKTGTGKFVFGTTGRRHLLTRHSRKLKRQGRADQVARITEQGHLRRMLPYL